MKRAIRCKVLAAALVFAIMLGLCPNVPVLAAETRQLSSEEIAFWQASDAFWPKLEGFRDGEFQRFQAAVDDGLTTPASAADTAVEKIPAIETTGAAAIAKYNEVLAAYNAVKTAYESCPVALRDVPNDNGDSINSVYREIQQNTQGYAVSQAQIDYFVAYCDGYGPMRKFITASHEYLGVHDVNPQGQPVDIPEALDRYKAAVENGEDNATILALYTEALEKRIIALSAYRDFCDKYYVIEAAFNSLSSADRASSIMGENGGENGYGRIYSNYVGGQELYRKLPEVPALSYGNAPRTRVNENVEEVLAKIALSAAESAAIEADEAPILTMTVRDAEPDSREQGMIANQLADYTVGQHMNIEVSLEVGGSSRKVTDMRSSISMSFTIPGGMRGSAGNRTFAVVRIHNGVATTINGTYDPASGRFTFETDGFSTYTLVYKDGDDSDNDDELPVFTSTGVGLTSSVPTTNLTGTAVVVSTPESTLYAAAKVPSGHYISMVVESSAGEKAMQILNNAANAAGATIASVMDISLNDMEQNGAVSGKITKLNTPIEIVVAAPYGVDAKVYDFAMIRIHDGEATILPDLDDDPATITFATDRFSAYAIVYGAKGSFDKYKTTNLSTAKTKDSVPKTGDSFPIAIPLAVVFVISSGALALKYGKKK